MTFTRLISKSISFLPDSLYLRVKFYYVFHNFLNLKNPKTFNEKLQWLKLHDRNPVYTMLADKYLVKDYVKATIGEEYIIPTLGAWDNADDIDINLLPDQFVLKCNHDSHSVFVCKDKSLFDFKLAQKKLNRSLKNNYFVFSREWPYKNIRPLVIAEKYMEDEYYPDLIDYKFFCFNGKSKYVLICSNRSLKLECDFYDMEFKRINVNYDAANSTKEAKKPKDFDKMIQIAEKLSANIPHVRIDLYEINNKIYFGEYTFFSAGGFDSIKPESFNYELGSYIIKI